MYKIMFNYFLKMYKELHKKDYIYFKSKLGIEYMKIKRLKLKEKEFISLIDWLYKKKKLSCINFLVNQLNDFHASYEYRDQQVVKATILHQNIMQVRQTMIDKCILCKKIGFINKTQQCKCLKKFLKIRDKMRKESL